MAMLEEIKKIQGINHDEFDSIITNYIESCRTDLAAIGIAKMKINNDDTLIHTAILTYVLSFLDVANSEMYSNSYLLQKDVLRHLSDYIESDDK
jgi:hypothetical protein